MLVEGGIGMKRRMARKQLTTTRLTLDDSFLFAIFHLFAFLFVFLCLLIRYLSDFRYVVSLKILKLN